MTQKVTPWEVSGKVDYDKLIKEFGTMPITDELAKKMEKLTGSSHIFLRRGLFFSHRDIDMVMKDYESGKGFFSLYWTFSWGRNAYRSYDTIHIV